MSFMSGDVAGVCAIPGIGVGDGADFSEASPLDFMPVMFGLVGGLCTRLSGVGVGPGIGICIDLGVAV